MRVLQLCKKAPLSARDGESFVIYHLLEALTESHEVTVDLLSFNTTKHFVNTDIINKPNHYQSMQLVGLNNHFSISHLLRSVFKNQSYIASRFRSTVFDASLKKCLLANNYDVVILESAFMGYYIDTIRKLQPTAKIVLRAHNVEYLIWKRLASLTPFGLKKAFLLKEESQIKKLEKKFIEASDLTLAISDVDQLQLASFSNASIDVLPVGVPKNNYLFNKENDKKIISFLGSLDWLPNLQGIQWFLKTIWPDIHAKYPIYELHIAGRNCPSEIFDYHGEMNICVHGEIEDTADFIDNGIFMVVPLKFGSGIRVKILEALSLGRMVLSTPIGREGIAETSGIVEFTDKKDILEILSNAEHLNQMDLLISSKEFIQKNHNVEMIAKKFYAQLQKLTA